MDVGSREPGVIACWLVERVDAVKAILVGSCEIILTRNDLVYHRKVDDGIHWVTVCISDGFAGDAQNSITRLRRSPDC